MYRVVITVTMQGETVGEPPYPSVAVSAKPETMMDEDYELWQMSAASGHLREMCMKLADGDKKKAAEILQNICFSAAGGLLDEYFEEHPFE